MIFNSWLETVRQRISRTVLGRRRRRSQQVAGNPEKLEDRTLLSVSALFSNGVLRVSSVDDNGPDSIEIGTDTAGNVQVIANGTPISGLNPSLSPSDVETIDVQGGDGSNLIDSLGRLHDRLRQSVAGNRG